MAETLVRFRGYRCSRRFENSPRLAEKPDPFAKRDYGAQREKERERERERESANWPVYRSRGCDRYDSGNVMLR